MARVQSASTTLRRQKQECNNWFSCTYPTARFTTSFFACRILGDERHHVLNQDYVVRSSQPAASLCLGCNHMYPGVARRQQQQQNTLPYTLPNTLPNALPNTLPNPEHGSLEP